MDAPDVWGREFPGEAFLDEEFNCLIAQATGSEGPHGRSLFLVLDNDIVDVLLGNSEIDRLFCVLWLRRECS